MKVRRGSGTIARAAVCVGTVATLAACSSKSDDQAVATTVRLAPVVPVATDPTREPVEVVDCGGRTSTYQRVPERIVALDEAMAEMLVLFGERDAVVGLVRDHPDDALWELTRNDLLSRQVVGDVSSAATRESVERVGPDLVAATDPARFEGPSAPATRDEWASAGIPSFLASTGCEPAADQSDDGLDRYLADLRALGLVLDAELMAEKLVSQAQAALQTLRADADAAGAGELTVWAVGGDGVDVSPTSFVVALLRTLGVRTVEAAPGDPSAVAAADPDLIWVITPRGTDPDEAGADLLAALADDPALASVTAVRQDAFVITPAADVAPSPRFLEGMRQLVDAIAAR